MSNRTPCLARATRVDLAEDELLELVVHRQDTGTGHTTEDCVATERQRHWLEGGEQGERGRTHCWHPRP